MQALSNMERSILVINELFPPEPTPTKFDKGLDLIKALSCATVPGAIGQVFETGIKAFQVIRSGRYKVEAVKYVADMYEVQQRAQVEMRRLEVQSEQNRNMTLFIEKSFQVQIDELSKEHLYRMRKLDSDRETVIHKIDTYAQIQLKEIDKRYSAIIRENEAKCILYRQMLQDMYEKRLTPADLMREASQQYFLLIQKSYARNDGASQSTQALFDRLMEFIVFMGDPQQFVSFQDFIERKKVIGD